MKYTKNELSKFAVNPMLSRFEANKERRGSRIMEYFDGETKRFLLDCVNGFYDDDDVSDVNYIADLINKTLEPQGFQEIGIGSNRIVFLREGFVYKIGMDRRGCIDNLSEYLRSIEEPEILAKVYETNRLIAVAEYANLLSLEEANARRAEMRDILSYASRRYVIQDLGTTPKNYCNWGKRHNSQLILIDYAYMYKIAGNEHALRCELCGSWIEPNDDFTAYRCSNRNCHTPYLTYEILNRMNRDVDECDDEQVIAVMGADDQGSDSSNFTYIKITGSDVGEMEYVSEEDSKKIAERVAERAAEEDEFLNTPSVLDVMNHTEMEEFIEANRVDDDDIPNIRMQGETAPALSFEEFTTLQQVLEDAKKTLSREGDPLYVERKDNQ